MQHRAAGCPSCLEAKGCVDEEEFVQILWIVRLSESEYPRELEQAWQVEGGNPDPLEVVNFDHLRRVGGALSGGSVCGGGILAFPLEPERALHHREVVSPELLLARLLRERADINPSAAYVEDGAVILSEAAEGKGQCFLQLRRKFWVHLLRRIQAVLLAEGGGGTEHQRRILHQPATRVEEALEAARLATKGCEHRLLLQ
mmetsp:Transcript_12789/g.29167  ORF Transcript_12789/g.29167 Transcript_12789/m.29167 type:complete len:201 (+) Transcript_12789:453-1055(+)